jgi:hypothetical protein
MKEKKFVIKTKESRPGMTLNKRHLILLFAIGLALKLYAFSQIHMISIDGAFQYIPVAKLFYQGEYLKALAQPQLPLYPFLIGMSSHITGSFELAGQLISIIFSLLAVFPFYLIGKSLFGPRPAFWATILYLINPLMLHSSVDVLKEGLLIFLFFSLVYCSLRFLEEGKPTWLILTAVFAAGGALVRLNTLVVLVVMGAWLGYSLLLREGLREKKLDYRYLWRVVPIFVVGAILVFAVIWGWDFLTTKKGYGLAQDFINEWFSYQRPDLLRVGLQCLSIVGRFIEKAYPLPFLLALFGLGWRIKAKEFSAEEKYLTLLIAVLIVTFFPLLYASGRYHLPAIFLVYLWAGFGFVKIGELIDKRFTKYRKATAVISVMILLGAMVPLCLQPQRLDKIGRKEVGLWLREHTLAPPIIMADDPRVAYYAGGAYVTIPPAVAPVKIVNMGMEKGVDYLVIEEKEGDLSDTFTPFEQQGDLKLVYRHPYGNKGKVIFVYKIRRHMGNSRKAS